MIYILDIVTQHGKVIYYLVPSITTRVQQFKNIVKLYNHILFTVKNFYRVMILIC